MHNPERVNKITNIYMFILNIVSVIILIGSIIDIIRVTEFLNTHNTSSIIAVFDYIALDLVRMLLVVFIFISFIISVLLGIINFICSKSSKQYKITQELKILKREITLRAIVITISALLSIGMLLLGIILEYVLLIVTMSMLFVFNIVLSVVLWSNRYNINKALKI